MDWLADTFTAAAQDAFAKACRAPGYTDYDVATCTPFFNDGDYITPTALLLSNIMSILGGVALLVVGLVGVACGCCDRWFMPFSSVMLLWRIALVTHSMAFAGRDVNALAALIDTSSELRLIMFASHALLTLLICVASAGAGATCARLGRAALGTQAVLLAVYLPMSGMQYETTGQHWIIMHLCGASGNMDLVEGSLALLHFVCGLQKINVHFFRHAPLFFGEQLHVRTLGLLPAEPTGTLISVLAPLMEIGGCILVIIGACAHRSTRCRF